MVMVNIPIHFSVATKSQIAGGSLITMSFDNLCLNWADVAGGSTHRMKQNSIVIRSTPLSILPSLKTLTLQPASVGWPNLCLK